MATFDYSKAAGIVTTSQDPVLDALQAQFGVPQCMLDFAKSALAAFPSPVLNSMKAGMSEGKALADSVFKDTMRKVMLDTGIVEYDTTLGRFVFVSSSSNKGVEGNASQSLNNMGGLGTILGFGAAAWVIGENVMAQIEDVKNCMNKMTSFNALQKGPSVLADKLVGFSSGGVTFDPPPPPAQASSEVFDSNKETLEEAANFIAAVDKQLQVIAEIQQCRQADPKNCPEPVFWANMEKNGETLEAALSGLTSFKLVDAEADAQGRPIVPHSLSGDPFNPFVDVINASGMLPPVSNQGQFLFSKTGVYYDSYGGGLNYSGCITNIVNIMYYDEDGNPREGVGVPPNSMKWLEEYNPNLGGKGEQVTWNTFNKWANTAFDVTRIDESPGVQQFYKADHFLQVLIDQRNRHIYDLSSYIGELQASGYSEDSALLSNQRQMLYSTIGDHDLKIKKRKKQIEVHVRLSPKGDDPVVGGIPINNFERLDKSLLAIEMSKQEHLIFNPGEVSGVVLPLCPSFIKSSVPQDSLTADTLMVPPVGVGQIITVDPSVEGTSGTILSLTDQIVTDRIVAVYNFLDADIVKPDSSKYLTINCATSSADVGVAQIVASSIPSMFPSGIGVPYFRGVCNFFSGVSGDGNPKYNSYAVGADTENIEYLHSAYRPYGYGRIETGYDPIDSLLYSNRGATFDFWTHVPDLGAAVGPGWNADSSLSALHRVVLGCENRGGELTTTNPYLNVGPANDSIKGLLVGFSRDRRITQGQHPSNNPADNDITKGLVFHMSPTQSVNSSSVSFISASANGRYCVGGEIAPSGYYGIAVDTSTPTANGHKFNDCSSMFVHTTISVDYGRDLVSIYLNGDLLASSTVEGTFGTDGPVPPGIPSRTDLGSFSYDIQYDNSLPPNAPLFPPNSVGYSDFWWWKGPQCETAAPSLASPAFTPWIIGGGYTDGMHVTNFTDYPHYAGTTKGMNFMGGDWGGTKSGLFGFIGSLKLYNRALNIGEASQNYNAQKGFFTNIRT